MHVKGASAYQSGRGPVQDWAHRVPPGQTL